MPRKPTRSGNESRPTGRNLSSRVDALDEDGRVSPGVAEKAVPLCLVVEPDAEYCVDEERRLYRLAGETYQLSPAVHEKAMEGA